MKTNISKFLLTVICMTFIVLRTYGQADNIQFLNDNHSMIRVQENKRFVLLPVEEKKDICNVRIINNNQLAQTINVRLAVDNIDYYVPVDISSFKGSVVLDIHNNGSNRNNGALKELICWKSIKYSDTFDASNREKFRPVYHHTPAYGWMNDPNGMFYLNGTWHLYYQRNPYGSQWENMTWGHSTSRDLINWEVQPDAILPDALGTIFSGSCVVDKNNTAGFGKNAIVACYTSASESQTQSMAYSTDNGRTFTKYVDNPVITSDVPDFRDPHIFWNDEISKWNLILAAGQEMRIYSSPDLKEWKYESSFGHGYGNHDGVWECPDLMELNVRGTDKTKWMLVCNINPGGPFGGSATQYFTGDFDGHKFTCESQPDKTKWMDYGKDHYAAVTFDNAPEGRHVIMGWMSNWQYAEQVPTMQYRSGNTIARDLGLYEYGGETYVEMMPSKEMDAARGNAIVKNCSSKEKKFKSTNGAYEITVDFKSSNKKHLTLTLMNTKGEQVVMTCDPANGTFSMNRMNSGETTFSESFPATTSAPIQGSINGLRIFVDRCSVEAFDVDGQMAMSNLVFPAEPYNIIKIGGDKNAKVSFSIYEIKK